MSWHLRLSSIPELEHLPKKQRRQAVRAAIGRFGGANLLGRPLVIGVLIGVAGAQLLGLPGALGIALFLAATLGIYLIDVRRVRYEIRKQIRREMAGERPPACLRCHFDLRGCEGETCPECGWGLTLPGPAREPRSDRGG